MAEFYIFHRLKGYLSDIIDNVRLQISYLEQTTGHNEGITHRYMVDINSTAIIYYLNLALDVKTAQLHIVHIRNSQIGMRK